VQMAERTYVECALFEHRFWLQVLGDHARFILNATSPMEEVEVKRAKEFVRVFDELLTISRKALSSAELVKLTQDAETYAKSFRAFKLYLLKRHLTGQLKCGLSPTFLNHMVNEIEEYIRILKSLKEEKTPAPVHPIHHHLLWLSDASGHASILASDIDMAEKVWIKRCESFAKTFEALYLKAIEIAGYLRSNIEKFPALSRFNQDAGLEMQLFRNFLVELEEMEINLEVLGALTPLMPDHMARESCYYLQKLSEDANVKANHCNPTTPRKDV
jgi:hypothetical protein